MTCFELNSSLARVFAGALFAAALALVPGCGSKDNRPLVVVDVPLGTYAVSGTTVKVTISLDGVQVAEESRPSMQVASGKIGVYLASGSSGSVTVKVAVSDDTSGCVLASGTSSAPVLVKAGEISATVSITLSAAGPCVVDGSAPPSVDSGVADGPGGDAPLLVDSQPTALDGPTAPVDMQAMGPDVQVLGPDVQVLDLGAPEDAKADAIPTPDVSVDAPATDLPPPSPDLGPDGPVDAPPTTLNALANCKAYTHTIKDSKGVIEDWGIRQVAFSPDGANLISFGEDGRAKLWNVTAAGLVESSSGLVFTGTLGNSVYGNISQDGKYVAVYDSNSQVTVYDLATSIKYGAPSTKWSLPNSALPVVPDWPFAIQFTSDGGHLVVAYSAYSSPDAHPFAVWDLGTQKIVRLVNYDHADTPMAVMPDSYTGSMWVASAAIGTTDAGADISTVTLMDVAQASPSKAQVNIDGDVYSMAFSPDGTTLAIGLYSGEVSLWDITTKSNIVRLGSPLVPASASAAANALAYTPDGKYLAAGLFDYSVRLVQLQQRLALKKSTDFLPWSVAFSPDGLGLAVGERDNGVLLYCRP